MYIYTLRYTKIYTKIPPWILTPGFYSIHVRKIYLHDAVEFWDASLKGYHATDASAFPMSMD
jgi:hypothetical protein